MSTLKSQPLLNGLRTTRHDPLLIGRTVLTQACVDDFQVTPLGNRHEVIAARIADQIFNTALLPSCMNISEERFKSIHTVKVKKHVVFAPTMPLQNLEHRWLEVIVDNHARNPAPEFKGMALTQQE